MTDEPAYYVRMVDGVYANCSKADPGALRVACPVEPPKPVPPPMPKWRCSGTLDSEWDDDDAIPMEVVCFLEAEDEEEAERTFRNKLEYLVYLESDTELRDIGILRCEAPSTTPDVGTSP